MVYTLYTEIEINASPAETRSAFLDLSHPTEWQEGLSIQRGSAEKAEIEKGDAMKVNAGGIPFNPIVLENSEEKFSWMGDTAPLLKGEHSFRFTPSTKTPGGTTFIQAEEFSGWCAFFFGPTAYLGKMTQQSFETFNLSLKRKAEKVQASS